MISIDVAAWELKGTKISIKHIQNSAMQILNQYFMDQTKVQNISSLDQKQTFISDQINENKHKVISGFRS